jgi:hypothetical protein
MRDPSREAAVASRYERLKGVLNERARRWFAASEALAYGCGGIAAVARATGIVPSTIVMGLRELRAVDRGEAPLEPKRIRRPGGGRKSTISSDPTLLPDLDALVAPDARGDPMSPLRWTCKGLRRLSAQLAQMGHQASVNVVRTGLRQLGYSLQGARKLREGSQHPDRNAQFEHINAKVTEQLATGQPSISVDTKKKELIGEFKNGGREWHPQGQPPPVRIHDFIDPELGRVNPYGIYDIAMNNGWVSVGIDHDTAAFAVHAIRRWWQEMGSLSYPGATRLLITADGGGSNGSRVRLWKVELQRLADDLGITIAVCHLPPGTSKWNKIEHRLFSFITQNWRGKPLVSHAVIVNLIASTTTKTGLRVRCELDSNEYPAGSKVTDDEMAAMNLQRDEFHGDWNYEIRPRVPSRP